MGADLVFPGAGGGGGGLSNPVSTAQGGLGVNNSAATGIPQFAAGVSSVATLPLNSALLTGTLPNAKGGTGSDTSATGGPNLLVKQTSVGGGFVVAAMTRLDFLQGIYLDRTAQFVFSDFTADFGVTGAGYDGTCKVSVTASGTVLSGNTVQIAGHPGNMQLGTGTAGTTGQGRIGPYPSLTPRDGTMTTEFYINIPVAATGTDDYFITIGFADTAGDASSGNMAAMRYHRATDATHWVIATAAAAVPTEAASTNTVTIGAASSLLNWLAVKTSIDPSGNGHFFVNGVELSNSPILAASMPTIVMGPICTIINVASAVAKVMNVDMFYQSYTGLART